MHSMIDEANPLLGVRGLNMVLKGTGIPVSIFMEKMPPACILPKSSTKKVKLIVYLASTYEAKWLDFRI